MTTALADERRAAAKLRAMGKARRAKQRARESQTWRDVSQAKRAKGCTCELRPGMTWDELLELGAGCTGSSRYRHPGWVCAVLDLYRVRVGVPKR